MVNGISEMYVEGEYETPKRRAYAATVNSGDKACAFNHSILLPRTRTVLRTFIVCTVLTEILEIAILDEI